METSNAVEAAGWFLTHAWLIPVIPAVAFLFIITMLVIWTTTTPRTEEIDPQ